MKFAIVISSIVSLLAATPIDSTEDHQLNRRLLDGLLGGLTGGSPYAQNPYGAGAGASPYSGFGAYRPRPLASVNLRDLSVLSPKQKDTQINIDEGMYNSYGYNPYAPNPWGQGPGPGSNNIH